MALLFLNLPRLHVIAEQFGNGVPHVEIVSRLAQAFSATLLAVYQNNHIGHHQAARFKAPDCLQLAVRPRDEIVYHEDALAGLKSPIDGCS